MKFLVGGLIAGLILYIVPGERSGPAYLLTGLFLSYLVHLISPRANVEKVVVIMVVSVIAWLAGPRAATSGQSFLAHVIGWLIAGSALCYYLQPKPNNG